MTTSVNPDLAAVQARWQAAWPNRNITLLLQAALSEPERALAAWRAWFASATFDAAPFTEIRLIAALAPRLRQLDPAFPEQARVNGFRRFVLAHNHQVINGTLPMLHALAEAGIRMMLLKGAARLAGDPAVAAGRFMADIDVLIERADWLPAMAIARARQWHYNPLPPGVAAMNLAELDDIYAFRHSVDFLDRPPPTHGHLDLHHHARHANRMVGDDDEIWAHASATRFLDLEMMVPSPTDQLLVIATHALRRSRRQPTGEWALDTAMLVSRPDIDWDRLVRDAIASKTQAPVGAALCFVERQLGLPVPARVLTSLAAASSRMLLDELDFRALSSFGPVKAKRVGQIAARGAAVARAKAALQRLPAQPGRGRAVVLAPVDAPRTMQDGQPYVFQLPADLQPTDKLTLELSCRVTASDGKAFLVLQCPYLILGRLGLPAVRKGGQPRHAATTINIDAALFVAAEMRTLQLMIYGEAKVDRLDAHWQRSDFVSRAYRRVRQWRSGLRRRLRALSA